MTSYNRFSPLIFLLFIATLTISSGKADPIENNVEGNNKAALIATTVAPELVPEVTLITTSKPLENIHQTHSTLHPSVKSNSSGNHHASNHSVPLVNEAPVAAAASSSSHHDKQLASKGVGSDPLYRLCDYLKPICNSTDKIAPKQLTKIQGQFKRIIQLSSGKLGGCFAEHYGFDPIVNPINKTDLVTICKSKDLPFEQKNSYKSFEVCANLNWNVSIDNELDKIMATRSNCTKNHNHSAKNETAAAAVAAPDLIHEDDEDEYSLISAVVNQVFEDNQGKFANSSDVKFIDVSGALNMPTNATQKLLNGDVSSNSTSSKAKTEREKTDAIMNDPNTVMVFIDDSKDSKANTTSTNKTSLNVNQQIATTIKPIVVANVDSTAANKTVESVHLPSKDKPSLGDKLLPKESSKKNSTSTSARATSTLSNTTTLKPTVIKTATEAPSHKGSLSEVVVAKTTLEPKLKLPAASTMKPNNMLINPTTSKPVFQTLEEILKRQEKEKQEFDRRLKEERDRVIKQLQKRQDEIDAQNAIKALQIQREASTNQHSDARLHQLEHDRQMLIDPIGHTIKHQQYEFNKQQRMMNGKRR